MQKRPYTPPTIEVLGSLAELTQGTETEGPDTMVVGSVSFP